MASLYEDEGVHDYILKKLANDNPGDFLRMFLESVLRADAQNYEILRPALLQIMAKYPRRNDRPLYD
jgi:hypothetical protein